MIHVRHAACLPCSKYHLITFRQLSLCFITCFATAKNEQDNLCLCRENIIKKILGRHRKLKTKDEVEAKSVC